MCSRTLSGLLLFVILPSVLISCGEAPDSQPLVYARGSDASKLDPHDVSDGESVKVIDQIYETLVGFPADPEGDLEPELATSWSTSGDGKTWTFRLRSDVTFHDGSVLEARDVVFSFRRLMNPGEYDLAGPYAAYYRNIASVEAVDPRTVRFQLKNRSAVFLRNLAMFAASIVNPKSVVEAGSSPATQPSGTGPYRFRSWSRGERIVLERYDGYWGEPAETKTVVFIPVRENSQRIQKLISGGAHIIDGIGLENLQRIRSSDRATLLEKPGMNMGYLAMNTGRAPFDHPLVRRAIAHGIDRKEIRADVFRGIGTIADTPLPPTIWGHHDGLDRYEYNPEKARRLLDRAGVDLDRVIRFPHMTNPRPYMADPPLLARKIKNDLEAIGFTNVQLRQMDWTAYIQAVQNGKHDLCLLGWITDNGDPDNFLSALFHSRNAEVGSANNVSFFQNKRYDRTVDRAKRILDRSKRTELYRTAQEILHEEMPVLPLMYMPRMAAKRTNVTGFELYSIGEVRLENAKVGAHGTASGTAY